MATIQQLINYIKQDDSTSQNQVASPSDVIDELKKMVRFITCTVNQWLPTILTNNSANRIFMAVKDIL